MTPFEEYYNNNMNWCVSPEDKPKYLGYIKCKFVFEKFLKKVFSVGLIAFMLNFGIMDPIMRWSKGNISLIMIPINMWFGVLWGYFSFFVQYYQILWNVFLMVFGRAYPACCASISYLAMILPYIGHLLKHQEDIGSFGWVVKIESMNYQNDTRISCSGALITPRNIISAGHCFDGNSDEIKVFFNNIERNWYEVLNGPKMVKASKVHIHPGWKNKTDDTWMNHDVAVLELKSEVTKTKFINLPNPGPQHYMISNRDLTFIGHGGGNYHKYSSIKVLNGLTCSQDRWFHELHDPNTSADRRYVLSWGLHYTKTGIVNIDDYPFLCSEPAILVGVSFHIC